MKTKWVWLKVFQAYGYKIYITTKPANLKKF